MNKNKIIKGVKDYIKELKKDDTSGHDWWHAYRVWKMSLILAKEEKDIDLFVVQLTALLHDIADWKFHGGDDTIQERKIKEILNKFGVDKKIIDHVNEIIRSMAYKSPTTISKVKTKEAMIIQDADRLDALGAIGIARAFVTGQIFGQKIYDPNKKVNLKQTPEEYKKKYIGEDKNTIINHFYEKLLLLKNQMNTKTAKKIAEKRHKFMKQYLDRFFKEWTVKL